LVTFIKKNSAAVHSRGHYFDPVKGGEGSEWGSGYGRPVVWSRAEEMEPDTWVQRPFEINNKDGKK
jgi:hypothetical protein